MKAPHDSYNAGAVRLAFYGRTNAIGVSAAISVARQFLTCCTAVDGRAAFNHFFFDVPSGVDDMMVLAVHGAGGPSRWDGGWDRLTSVLPDVDRGFSTIVCSSVDRLSRRRSLMLQRQQPALDHGVSIRFAVLPWDGPVSTSRADRLIARVVTAIREQDYDLACERRQAGGL